MKVLNNGYRPCSHEREARKAETLSIVQSRGHKPIKHHISAEPHNLLVIVIKIFQGTIHGNNPTCVCCEKHAIRTLSGMQDRVPSGIAPRPVPASVIIQVKMTVIMQDVQYPENICQTFIIAAGRKVLDVKIVGTMYTAAVDRTLWPILCCTVYH